jgi:cytochrome c5
MSVQHESWIKTPRQLITVVVVAFIVPIVLIVLLSQLVTGREKGAKESDVDIIARIRPVGQVQIAEPGAPKGQSSGEQVFNQVCKNCHEAGVAGAPKFGDKAAWSKVIAEGQATAVDHATKGIRGMPPKGGNPNLDDVEVARAVAFMANKVGANWKEPEAPKVGTPTTAAAPAAASAGAAAPAAAGSAPAAAAPPPAAPVATPTPAAASKPDGKKVYDTVCTICHGTGVAGAPKFGDKAAWAPRLKTGMDALYASALKGKNAMPAKGGNPALSDAEVKAAVDYMAAAAK